MELVFKHFWIFCGLWCGVGGGLYFRARLQVKIREGKFTSDEVNKFSKYYALWIFVPCILFWLIQQSLGTGSNPMYSNWPNPQKLVAISLQIFLWIALIKWIFLDKGAETLSAYASASQTLFKNFNSPTLIKVLVIVGVVAGLFSLFKDVA